MLDILLQSPVPAALAIVGIAWLCAEALLPRRRQALAPLVVRTRSGRKHRS